MGQQPADGDSVTIREFQNAPRRVGEWRRKSGAKIVRLGRLRYRDWKLLRGNGLEWQERGAKEVAVKK
jgi:hypothetical protein